MNKESVKEIRKMGSIKKKEGKNEGRRLHKRQSEAKKIQNALSLGSALFVFIRDKKEKPKKKIEDVMERMKLSKSNIA